MVDERPDARLNRVALRDRDDLRSERDLGRAGRRRLGWRGAERADVPSGGLDRIQDPDVHVVIVRGARRRRGRDACRGEKTKQIPRPLRRFIEVSLKGRGTSRCQAGIDGHSRSERRDRGRYW